MNEQNVIDRLKECVLKSGFSYAELEKKTNIPKSSIQRYVSGTTKKIPIDFIEKIAKVIGVNVSYIMGWDNISKKYNKIPVLGVVRAGLPIEAVQNIIDYEEISDELTQSGEFFALQIKGDSMEPKMSEGDVVIVRKQESVDNGQVAVVLINGEDATIKKYQKTDNGVKLIATNPAYDPLFFTPDEVENLPVRVIGRVVELRQKYY